MDFQEEGTAAQTLSRNEMALSTGQGGHYGWVKWMMGRVHLSQHNPKLQRNNPLTWSVWREVRGELKRVRLWKRQEYNETTLYN